MKFSARISILTIAAVFSCGVLPAAHATTTDAAVYLPEHEDSAVSEATPSVEPEPTLTQPEPSPSGSNASDPSTSTPVSPGLPTLPVSPGTPGSSGSTGSPGGSETDMTMHCAVSYQSGMATVSFSPGSSYDALTVTVAGQQVSPEKTTGNSIALRQTAKAQHVVIELWRDESLLKECAITLAAATPQPPPSPSPSPSPSASAQPSPTPTQQPTSTPTPSPSSSAPSSAAPTESSPPVPTTAPSAPPTSGPGGQDSTPAPVAPSQVPTPASSQSVASDPSVAPIPRIIRQFSDDPRYLLPQLFGTETGQGSQLIMPRPRDQQAGDLPLETLPPVSEDELDAIKAELSAPHRADRTPPTTAHIAQSNPELTQRTILWPLVYLIGPLVVVGVLWGLLWRRRSH